MLDTMLQHHIRIPQELSIAGYEYVQERIYHAPLLTTFQRNRFVLGQNAVTLLSSQLEGQLEPELLPMTGKMIRGNSCACGVDWTQLQTELVQIREEQRFQILNLFSQPEQHADVWHPESSCS